MLPEPTVPRHAPISAAAPANHLARAVPKPWRAGTHVGLGLVAACGAAATPRQGAVRKGAAKELLWPEEPTPVTKKEEKKVWDVVKESYFNFRKLEPEEMDQMLLSLQEKLPESAVQQAGMAGSMRRQVMFNATILNHGRLKTEATELAKISRDLQNREELCAPVLSRKLNLPPHMILKEILVEERLKKTLPRLYKLLDNAREEMPFTDSWEHEAQAILKETLPSPLDPWLLREVLWTVENDHEAKHHRGKIMASAFEDALVQFCQDAGHSVQTELELLEQGSQEGMLITPDLLFESPISLPHRKESVRWMECKSFYGTTFNFVMQRKLLKQAKRYANQLGPGALVFRHGYSAAMKRQVEEKVPGVVVLDGSRLPDLPSPLDSDEPSTFVAGPKAEFWKLDLPSRSGKSRRSGSGKTPAKKTKSPKKTTKSPKKTTKSPKKTKKTRTSALKLAEKNA
ncbi:unnamed protein product [Symbiodinium sp. CCMP2456]|nr:unnamed protein product [Symbiodinium sp. CCMP2456]